MARDNMLPFSRALRKVNPRSQTPIIALLVYSALIMVVLSLPAPFHGADKVLLYGFLLAVLWYVCALYWRLRRGTAGVKPIDEFVD